MTQSQSQVQQGREASQFQLRLPDNLKAKILEASTASGRSINSEIVLALTERYLPEAARTTIDPTKLYTLEEATKMIVDTLLDRQKLSKK